MARRSSKPSLSLTINFADIAEMDVPANVEPIMNGPMIQVGELNFPAMRCVVIVGDEIRVFVPATGEDTDETFEIESISRFSANSPVMEFQADVGTMYVGDAVSFFVSGELPEILPATDGDSAPVEEEVSEKRGRGRPRKEVAAVEEEEIPEEPKRGRGRPKLSEAEKARRAAEREAAENSKRKPGRPRKEVEADPVDDDNDEDDIAELEAKLAAAKAAKAKASASKARGGIAKLTKLKSGFRR